MDFSPHFLTDINHALRTPLTAILGWSDLLASDDDPALRPVGEALLRSSEQLTQAVAIVLDEIRARTEPAAASAETLPGAIRMNGSAGELADLDPLPLWLDEPGPRWTPLTTLVPS